MKRDYVNTPLGQVHYCEEGKGRPVLFLHQTPTSSDEFADVLPIVGKQYRAIAMDTLGYGCSDKPKEPTLELYAKSVGYLLDSLKIDKTSIVGNLTGAWIAIEFAAKNPRRVDKLALGAVVLTTKEEDEKSRDLFLFKPLEIKENGSFLIDLWNYYRKVLPQMKPENTFRIVRSVLMAGANHHRGHIAVIEYKKEGIFQKIKCPVLLLYSELDIFLSKRAETEKVLPQSKTHLFKGKTFAVGYEYPEALAKAVTDFISQ